ncbi:MAG: magnesium/cobalt transporter CorA, partial [Acidobacteria bacterium]|nr:magnesium/cobalt transporter CorA [Acidobacteriota bacterium]MDW7984907.1 magnesium/cobalt transporter CorA [Acidobacteriota bacterium]
MPRFFKRYAPPGTSPGVLTLPPEVPLQPVSLAAIYYHDETFEEFKARRVTDVLPYLSRRGVLWLNVEGLDRAVLEELGQVFSIHPLTLEDILHTGQRPKIEDYEHYVFIVQYLFRRRADAGDFQMDAEQINIILGTHYVLTVQEGKPGDAFDPIRDRIRSGRGRIRRMGADYLAYALLDTIVDHYFPLLEAVGETVEDLQDELVLRPSPQLLPRLHALKRELLFMRRTLWPTREVVLGMMDRIGHQAIHAETRVYLRDVYDHAVQVIDILETYREMLADMVDVYLSSVSNQINQVMKVLTIIATIFIPLTFIVGIYGMNFN